MGICGSVGSSLKVLSLRYAESNPPDTIKPKGRAQAIEWPQKSRVKTHTNPGSSLKYNKLNTKNLKKYI